MYAEHTNCSMSTIDTVVSDNGMDTDKFYIVLFTLYLCLLLF